jgi:hypothetical protein
MALAYSLTTRQLGHIDEMIAVGEELVGLRQSREGKGADQSSKAVRKPMEARLDRACLHFCDSILDHTLKGDLFESTAVGFLAALAVDPEKNILRDASSFTSYLSAFV